MIRSAILYVICATIVACQSSTNQAFADLVGPTPYFQASDSPFVAFAFDFFHLEDFEDGIFNVPGVIKSAGNIIGPGLAADSVDADDGSVDGSGNGGRSLFIAGGALTFTFDPSVLGGLPTHVGVVRTDGGSTATGPRILFEAFGPGMNSLGTISAAFGDGNSNGGTAEDRFLGWFDPNGILAIRVPSGVFEVDHLQFGSSVPEPSTVALFVCAFMVAGLFKLRTVRRLRLLHMPVLGAALGGPLTFYTNAAATEPFFMGLGDLPGGTSDSRAFGVSADGSVVVGSTSDVPGAASAQAFRWTRDTGMVGLGEASSAYDISADGLVIVGQWGSQAFRWTQETGLDGLGDLPRGAFFSFANAVSADGSVVVGLGSTDFCPRGCVHIYPPFRWTPTSGMARLGMPIERRFDHRLALDVSADGLVIVGGATEASMWTQTEGSIGLGDLPDGPAASSRAYGVSADGSVIVGVANPVTSNSGEAFRWTQKSGMIGLGIPPGFEFSLAQDVSADGSIVVGTLGLGTGSAGAFVWDAIHGMRNLRDVLINSIGAGASLDCWTLSDATAISADGRVVVGYGINPSGNTEAWIARLDAASRLAGDFNRDGTVDAADYIVWRKGVNTTSTQNDYNVWRAHFGQTDGNGVAVASTNPLSAAVPEPSSVTLLLIGGLVTLVRNKRRVAAFAALPLVLVPRVASSAIIEIRYSGTIEYVYAHPGAPLPAVVSGTPWTAQLLFDDRADNLYPTNDVDRSIGLYQGIGIELVMEHLGDLPGGSTFSSSASGVSANGYVVVGYGTSATVVEAIRWTHASGMNGLGILPGFKASLAQDVSADGSLVVGYSGEDQFTPGEAFLWDPTQGMRSRRELLINDLGLAASLAGWTLTTATDISADGQFIVGSGTNPSGNTEAWIARLHSMPRLAGDFNNDGSVDAADYVAWRKGLGTTYTQNDFSLWRANFGKSAGSGEVLLSTEPLQAAVPEPGTLELVTLAMLIAFHRFFRRQGHATVL